MDYYEQVLDLQTVLSAETNNYIDRVLDHALLNDYTISDFSGEILNACSIEQILAVCSHWLQMLDQQKREIEDRTGKAYQRFY